MKPNFLKLGVLAAGAILLLSSCDKKEDGLEINNASSIEFIASMPSAGIDAVDTKTTTVDGTRVLWCNSDHISIFRGRNVNEEYKVKDGFSGKTTTTFVKANDDEFSGGSGDPFEANIAYYPYGNVEYIGSNGSHALSANIPSTQTYAKGSFGEGTLPMVAVTSSKNDNALDFKNLFGFLKLQLKSAESTITIKQIIVKGNNDEKLSGEATVSCLFNGEPTIKFNSDAGKSIILDCNNTTINATSSTDFWIALPPVTFSKGIIVEIVTSATTIEKKTSASLTITRSKVKPMEVLTIKSNVKNYQYELYVCPVKHGGMSMNKNGIFVRKVNALTADQPTVKFDRFYGKGLEITNKYTMESITKGKYHYQIPESGDRFVKFEIKVDASGSEFAELISEKPFVKNTYFARKYTHAWIDNGTTLIIVGTDADNKVVSWSKLRESDMSVISEGTLDIAIPEGFRCLSTSGLLTYREKSKDLLYFYVTKNDSGRKADVTASRLHVALIDPTTMAIKSDNIAPTTLATESAASAYGELMQNTIMYDENGNLYIAGLTEVDKTEFGSLLRIKAGEVKFDESYNGFPNPEGKLLTVQYLGNGKALAYSRKNSLGTKIDSPSHFYSIINLSNGNRERVKYNGTDLPYCSGRFSQRTAIVNGKAYIGIANQNNLSAGVYIYDIASGKVERGVKLQDGFCFDIIRAVEMQ